MAAAAYGSNSSFSVVDDSFSWTLDAAWEKDNTGEFAFHLDTIPIKQTTDDAPPNDGTPSRAYGTAGEISLDATDPEVD